MMLQKSIRATLTGLVFGLFVSGGVMLSSSNALSQPITADEKAVAVSNNNFALNLYQRARPSNGNIFFSPFSISEAVAMAYAGARNDTARDMAATLHFTLEPERLHAAMGGLQRSLESNGNYKLTIANALWLQQGYPIKSDFLALTKHDYEAAPQQVDFKNATEQARQTINGWVEQKTDNKIVELLKPKTLTTDTRFVLTNAIYFKADWASPFEHERTYSEDFQTGAQKVAADFMHQKAHFPYTENDLFQAVDLPYKGDALSMTILLPKKGHDLAELETALTQDALQGWIASFKTPEEEIQLSLPKFKTSQTTSLGETLAAMGMKSAFTYPQADFSGISDDKQIFIGDVLHSAIVAVDEQGTEAAAATAVLARPGAAPAPTKTIIFRADHPFLFFIRDKQSGSLLFIGRFADPA